MFIANCNQSISHDINDIQNREIKNKSRTFPFSFTQVFDRPDFLLMTHKLQLALNNTTHFAFINE